MRQSPWKSTSNAAFGNLSTEEERSSRHGSANTSFNHPPKQPQQPLRPMSGQALDTIVGVVALCDNSKCTPGTSQTEEAPIPPLCDMNNESADALMMRKSSSELDGYCSSCEGSLPDDSASSSSERDSPVALPTRMATTLRKSSSRKPHSHHHRYRCHGSPPHNAARDEERQQLVAMSFSESTATSKAGEEQLVKLADSATTTVESPAVSSPSVSMTGGPAREGAFRGIRTPYPKPITATTSTKTSLAMISAALNVESHTAEAAMRNNNRSPCPQPLNEGGNTRDAVPLQALACEGGGASEGALRPLTTSRLSRLPSKHSDAVESSINSAEGNQCFVEPPPTTMVRLPTLSPVETVNLVDTAVLSSNGTDGCAVATGDVLQVALCGVTNPSLVDKPACVAPVAADVKSHTVNNSFRSVTRAAASEIWQETAQGPSVESPPDKKLSRLPAGEAKAGVTGVASQATPVTNVPTLTSTNAKIALGDAAAQTSTMHQQTHFDARTRVDLSSSSSVGGHHLSVTEGNAFLKQSGSRREEAFYNTIRPYQEALVREAVRQAPHTVQHWSHHHAGTPCAGVQQSAASGAASTLCKEENLSPLHISATHRSRDDDSDSIVADPDDVAAMCEARWEAYQQYEAEDMSNLNILASEQLEEKNLGRERERSGGGSDSAGPLYSISSSPTSPRQVDKDLVELAARLWWTVRFRHFYRTSAPAYEVQRQAAKAAGLSPLLQLARSPTATACDSGSAAVTHSWCTTPVSQRPHHEAQDTLEVASPPLPPSPMGPSTTEPEKVGHIGEAAMAMAPGASGTATPCMVGSFSASLLEGLTSNANAAERQYAVQKHRALQLLAAFVPRYHGTRCLFARDVLRCERKRQLSATSTEQESKGDLQQPGRQQIVVDADNDDEDKNSGDKKICRMIMLEYVCYRFRRPCVMDIKMGSRQYGLHPSAEKKRSKERKATLSTSARYGIRLAGYRRWNAEEGRYNCRSKLQCRCLSLKEVKNEMSIFLLHNRDMEQVFRRQLQRLRVAFSQQTIFRFYTSSLLFVYDADDPLKTARVTMVDFAYTYESKELLQDGDPDAEFAYDVGYLKALDTLLSLLA
ncbi:inositol polyphosphate kinase-like protein, putative [Leishmania tarentolae]|uniref:Kinase n=1 Tax=Leishmania tarentolae TaxID=5689 RepID=A0A640KBJ3_LEITA|nr:inositol polyphosphate kinase-like protein, putative [Leishmania tarentolae]